MAAARAGSRPAADGGCDTARRQYGHGWFRRVARHRLQDPTWEFRSESSLRRLEASTRKAAGAGGGDSGPSSVGLGTGRSEEHTSELQALMRISYAVCCLKKKKKT